MTTRSNRLPTSPPRGSWWSSLRPNARTVRPDEASVSAPPTRRSWSAGRRTLVLGAGIAGLAGLAAVALVAHRSSRSPQHLPPVAHLVSGRAGLRTTASGADERWSQASITVVIDPSLAGATPTAKEAIVGAFGAWMSTKASLPQFTFDSSSTPGQAVEDGVNRLVLAPITVAGHERDLAITISYADGSTGEILEADTIFNSAYPWADIDGTAAGDDDGHSCGQHYDLQNVATHEAGHFFGLGEDYEDTTTTMFVSSRPCQTSKRVLTAADVSAIAGLYKGGPAATASSCGAHIAKRGDTHGGALVGASFLAFAAVRRQRRRARGSAR